MRTVRFHRHGDLNVLVIEEVDVPTPGPGQVLIRPELVAGSFVDTTMRRGDGPFGPGPLPSSPHSEVVGTVEAVGSVSDSAWHGRRVAALVFAEAYADAVLADAAACVPVPEDLSAADASVLAMAAPVAMAALSLGRFEPGDTVLVQAAAGSIGHLAVQVARLLGASKVVGAVGSTAKLDVVRDLGAEAVALDGDWAGEVRALAPGGVDVALDSAGGQISADTLDLLDHRLADHRRTAGADIGRGAARRGAPCARAARGPQAGRAGGGGPVSLRGLVEDDLESPQSIGLPTLARIASATYADTLAVSPVATAARARATRSAGRLTVTRSALMLRR